MYALPEHRGRNRLTDTLAHFRIIEQPIEIVLQGLVIETFSIEIAPDKVDLFLSLELRHRSSPSSLTDSTFGAKPRSRQNDRIRRARTPAPGATIVEPMMP